MYTLDLCLSCICIGIKILFVSNLICICVVFYLHFCCSKQIKRDREHQSPSFCCFCIHLICACLVFVFICIIVVFVSYLICICMVFDFCLYCRKGIGGRYYTSVTITLLLCTCVVFVFVSSLRCFISSIWNAGTQASGWIGWSIFALNCAARGTQLQL